MVLKGLTTRNLGEGTPVIRAGAIIRLLKPKVLDTTLEPHDDSAYAEVSSRLPEPFLHYTHMQGLPEPSFYVSSILPVLSSQIHSKRFA